MHVLKDVAHRQWVFTIPKVLRKLFYKDRLLLAKLARCAAATILEREEVIRILKHLEMWPIEYPKPCPVEARASPFDFKLLRKLSN